MSIIEKVWYQEQSCLLGLIVLYPLSCLFSVFTRARRAMYLNGILKSTAVRVPVIIVGGINVGGTGKTPLCIALVKELQQEGLKVGVLSRGYKATITNFPCLVDDSKDASLCGDEPFLIYKETNATVVIDPNRVRGAQYLEELSVDVIVCDDGLQHYKLARDVEIAVVDGVRKFGNRLQLPAGPLRESVSRLNSVDAVVINGQLVKSGNYTMNLLVNPPYPLSANEKAVLVKGSKVCAMAGIGNPQRFYDTLKTHGFIVEDTINVPDHGLVDKEVLLQKSQNLPIVMTQKDAIKYQDLDLSNVFVLKVTAQLSKDFYAYVKKRIRDSKYNVQKNSIKD